MFVGTRLPVAVEIPFPIEFVVHGTPASAQTKRPSTRERWKETVRLASRSALPEGHFATEAAVAVTLFYFPLQDVQGDLDNIVKPVLDALSRHIYLDDRQVERRWVERFDVDSERTQTGARGLLSALRTGDRPALYVRLTADLEEEFR